MHRLREGDALDVGKGAADVDQVAGDPLRPGSGGEEGEKRKDVDIQKDAFSSVVKGPIPILKHSM